MASLLTCNNCREKSTPHLFYMLNVMPLCFNCISPSQILEQLQYYEGSKNLDLISHGKQREDIEILKKKSQLVTTQPKLDSIDFVPKIEVVSLTERVPCIRDKALIQRYFVP